MVDIGAGDGLASIRAARSDPSMLAIALDPSIDRLRVGARTALRQKIANVLFVVVRIEDAPRELDGAADEATISFPWGSLLRGIVRADSDVVGPLSRMTRAGAPIDVTLSVEARDSASGVSEAELSRLAEQATRFAAMGLALERCALLPTANGAALNTSWGKRLDRDRRVYRVRLRRCG